VVKLKNVGGAQQNVKRIMLVILIGVIAALVVAASGCTYQAGGQNGTQNATQNASYVNIRLPVLPNLFGNATNNLVTISNRLSSAVCGLSVLV
jgi:flagellar basal body-associated protein FliL